MSETGLDADVIVVGAGPAGSATAALLADAGWEVLLLDRAHFPRSKPCAELLSPGAVAALMRLGACAALGRGVGRHVRGMELCAPGGVRCLVEYRAGGGPAWGLAAPRYDLDAALLHLAGSRGARVEEGFRVTEMLVSDGALQGVLGSNARGRTVALRARLVVGADGLHSLVTRRLGLRRPRRWPRRLGLVAHLDGVSWPSEHGEMHVGRRGYVGVAPLGENLVSVGLVMPLPRGRLGPPEAALQAALAEYPALLARLRRAAPGPLPAVRGIGPLAQRVRACAGPGYALVGDAAGFLDPFTGEGIFRALRGAEILARLADRVLGASCGAIDVGEEYVRARQAAFQSKEWLTLLIQVFVHSSALMDYAVERLRRRPHLAVQLGSVLGDLEPAGSVLRPGFLWQLLRP